MKILLIDDEIRLLKKLHSTVEAVAPTAELFSFSKAREALEFANEVPLDVAFLDINMRIISGLTLAQQLQALYPRINIIFCTGYSEYALDAHGLHCSGYLLKPVTEEKVRDALQNLRFSLEDTAAAVPAPKKRVEFRCFGNFEVFIDGIPVRFRYDKTRELLAYLVDRRGASSSPSEIAAVLWDDEENHINYMKSLRRDLILTLEEHLCGEVLLKKRGKLAILPNLVSCDYYDWSAGLLPESAYRGEYMAQYSWAEYVNGFLLRN